MQEEVKGGKACREYGPRFDILLITSDSQKMYCSLFTYTSSGVTLGLSMFISG